MSLTFAARLGARGFDVALDVPAGQTVAVLGPNGAGKSTLVGLLAGLLRPEAGRAELGGRTLFDLGSADRPERWLAPHERGTSLLAQDALLFPHLSVLDNVAFGLRSTGAGRRDAAARAATWLDAVGATDLARRRPAELSGGQAQRVAVARALAPDPRLLLLDEPLAALDAAVAPHLRRLLRTVLADRTALVVTHDVLDAYALADRVVVLAGGRVVEDGPTRDVLGRPQHAFTARLAGLNLLTGVRTPGGMRTPDGVELVLDGERPRDGAPAVGTQVVYAFRPGEVSVRPSGAEPGAGPGAGTGAGPGARDGAGPGASERASQGALAGPALCGVVTDLESRGDVVRVGLATGAARPGADGAAGAASLHADVPVERAARLRLAPGDVVDLGIPRGAALYPAQPSPTGRSLHEDPRDGVRPT